MACAGVSSRSARCSTEHGLQIAPSTYYEHVNGSPSRRQRAGRVPARARSAGSTPPTTACTGPGRCGSQLNREGIPVARCTVERLMRRARPDRRGPGQGQAHHDRRPGRRPRPGSGAAATSPRRPRTGSGSPTSPTCPRGRGGRTSRSSSTPTPAGSWAGGAAGDEHPDGPGRPRAGHLDPST